MSEFVNFLSGKGCGVPEATTCFQELDSEGEGGIDVTYCLAVSACVCVCVCVLCCV